MTGQLDTAACLADIERLAAAALPGEVWDFVAGGGGDELTMAANRTALDGVSLVPRVLTGAPPADTRGKLLGESAGMPVAVAPMAYQRLVHPGGELAAARACRHASIPFVISTLSSFSIERIAETGAALWFQLYWLRDRGLVTELVRRAELAGCAALMVTVDVPVMGRRRRDVRNRFHLPPDIVAANLGTPDTEAHRAGEGSAVAAHTSAAFEPALSWADLEWLREQTTLPLVVKGILDPRDARAAVGAGADALVVSNHGGRQFDGGVPSIAALPAIAGTVGCELLLDSGIRSGLDILRARALGASGVLVGRPVLHGLAAGGEAGVGQVLSLLRAELLDAMTLAGWSGTGRHHVLLDRDLSAITSQLRPEGNP